jgi:hypothetical protein
MMKLAHKLVTGWPKLAWVSKLKQKSDVTTIYHGSSVEVNEHWCVEAVWAGDYKNGEFDQTDLIFGSGVRCRDKGVVFVSSGSTMDRLWYYSIGEFYFVANSLPALMAVSGTSFLKDHSHYVRDINTIVKGLSGYTKQIPCKEGKLRLVYFDNLFWDGVGLTEIVKPDTAPHFDRFETYAAYLMDTASLLAKNMNDPARSHTITPMVTVSEGYDSSMAAVIAQKAGCRQSVTIGRSTSLWRGSDSGEEVAEYLGMECKVCDRTARRYLREESIWAVAGRASILNWTLFDYPESLCFLFTGPYGDNMWSRNQWEFNDPLQWTLPSNGGIGEFRLFKGIFHCPVPFWGMRHLQEIWDITASKEMEPWSIPGGYDRPVPRRIVEEAGVPRHAFGLRKKNTSHDEPMLWPYTPEAADSFRRFLTDRGVLSSGPLGVWMQRKSASLVHLIESNLPRSFSVKARKQRKQSMDETANLLFQWANIELSKTYIECLVTAHRQGFLNNKDYQNDKNMRPGIQ